MTAVGAEGLPTTWNNDRDSAFFRMTAALFPAAFTYGASVLLASYDDECGAASPFGGAALSTEGITALAPISGARTS